MNYNHHNKIHQFWMKKMFPNFQDVFNVPNFGDYVKRFSELPSGKWISDVENVKFERPYFAIDPVRFVKKYKDKCVTYNPPTRPEDGFQRAIYQISTTLHLEAVFWVWVENKDELNSYASVFVLFNEKEEYVDFLKELYKLRRTGNTEESSEAFGFNK